MPLLRSSLSPSTSRGYYRRRSSPRIFIWLAHSVAFCTTNKKYIGCVAAEPEDAGSVPAAFRQGRNARVLCSLRGGPSLPAAIPCLALRLPQRPRVQIIEQTWHGSKLGKIKEFPMFSFSAGFLDTYAVSSPSLHRVLRPFPQTNSWPWKCFFSMLHINRLVQVCLHEHLSREKPYRAASAAAPSKLGCHSAPPKVATAGRPGGVS